MQRDLLCLRFYKKGKLRDKFVWTKQPKMLSCWIFCKNFRIVFYLFIFAIFLIPGVKILPFQNELHVPGCYVSAWFVIHAFVLTIREQCVVLKYTNTPEQMLRYW